MPKTRKKRAGGLGLPGGLELDYYPFEALKDNNWARATQNTPCYSIRGR